MATTYILSRFAFKHTVLLVTFLLFVVIVGVVEGTDLYSNSFISPQSIGNSAIKDTKFGDRTSAPKEIKLSQSSSSSSETVENNGNTLTVNYNNKSDKVKRSAEPILSRTASFHGMYKNVDDTLDSNDVELSGRMLPNIKPSKTYKDGININDLEQTLFIQQSGEAQGAPQGRSMSVQEPQEIMPTATMPAITATLRPHQSEFRGRQANPDIQDIITGIVKLLNGNVNVQANTAPVMAGGRPLRPVSTRINNRGPPRITDVPALPPDFDMPAPPLPPPPLGQMPPPVTPTRMPTPYPFDIPPHNTSPIRPGFYRPVTIPPWNRRKPPNRRPNPNIPPYKPLPDISLTSENPIQDILTLDLGAQLQPTNNDEDNTNIWNDVQDEPNKNFTEYEPTVNISKIVDKEIENFEKNKEKSTSKMNKHASTATRTSVISETSTSTSNTIKEKPSDTVIASSTVVSTSISNTLTSTTTTSTSVANMTSTMATKISSITSFIVPNTTTTTITTSTSVDKSTPTLESSIQDVLQTMKEDFAMTTSLSSSPTESLPTISTKKLLETKKTPQIQTIISSSSSSSIFPKNNISSKEILPYYSYRPRPGIVLDDTEYKPGGINRQPTITRSPIGQLGDIFDITVSAIQGPGSGSSGSGHGKPYVIPVDIENIHTAGEDVVITSPVGSDGFVSIDGKRTYLNLFGDGNAPSTVPSSIMKPTSPVNNQVTGTGYAVVDNTKTKPNLGSIKPTQSRPIYGRPPPSQPPVRIDTCIVGDDSTCDGSQHEICRTEAGVSACHCRPGHARRKHRDPCRKIVSVILSLRVDRIYERRIVWVNDLRDKNSDSYQQLAYEAERALESAMSMTPFSDEFLRAKVNNIYPGERAAGQAGVFVNMTLQLDENQDTSRPTVRGDIQRHLLGVIQRRSNNVGNSALWVDSPPGSVSNLQDLDECSSPELHDCHALARCINVFGGYRCECGEGYRDPWADSKIRAGRQCDQCSPQHCNNRGECKYQNGHEVCVCTGNYYGNQCELDGEVLGVAIGASVAAVIIIGLTLVCLVMWSRKWSREQKAAIGSPVFGYMATASNTVKTPGVGAPPYQLTMEDRLRWAQIADVMAQTNHYAPEPVNAPTRPSSALFGYPNLTFNGTLPHGNLHGTLPPVPLPRLNLQAQLGSRTAASLHGMRPFDNSSSSEEEDKADLLGRNFQVPRPKSRSNASIANQSGIYYDVDYDQNEIYKQAGGIPLSTYTVGRPYYRS